MTAITRLCRRACVAALALSSLALVAPASAAPVPAEIGPTSFSGPGPYAVGERTLTLASGVEVEVWYPATKKAVQGKPEASYDVVDWLPDFLKSLVPEGQSVTYPSGGVRGVPVRTGKYPLVVFSHGYAGFRDQSSALTSAIASWGFVVAAPDHPSRDLTKVLLGPAGTTTDVQDLRQTITLIGKKTDAKKGWLRHRVDMRRIGALGHSAGGRAVEQLAAVDKRVDTFIGMAPASADTLTGDTDKPRLIITGTADGIIPVDQVESAYAAMGGDKRIVLVDNAGHLVFSDLCEIGESQGGLLAIGELLGITIPDALRPLATDGCQDTALEPTLAWPAIQQVVVAQLRHQLGVDPTDAGLAGLTEAYPGIISDSRVG
ncbi:alpha/beta hydrolase family protein [Nocardioides mangrovi]|uniref:Dienelactone hydrolase family protein n=1 Tax=Nocardioides mangrovi TaxID=2874580 RepID=A0ABS7UFA7_9ACTN|nr:dienelactone hydrolase family protein [Nocardioides mangrovi]MBZ5739681.1 dienelactone hydrolase family protein [Nocardioides mangrovi]